MISSIVLSQIAGSVWLLRKVGDSETLAKSVLLLNVDKYINARREYNMELIRLSLSFLPNGSI